MSWGYDQTNVNFFKVTRKSEKGIFVREIQKRGVTGTDGFMCNEVVPVKDAFLTTSQWCGKGYGDHNPEMFRKVNEGNKPSFSIKGRYFAYLTDEIKSHYCSWYA